MRGKNGIHLDDKEHAILEHCLNPDITKELNLMLLLDVEYVEEAHAHRAASGAAHDASCDASHLDLESVVCFAITFLCSTTQNMSQSQHFLSLVRRHLLHHLVTSILVPANLEFVPALFLIPYLPRSGKYLT
jgi:hypothetical protein